MKIERFDAVVIGSGCAGYNCADWLYDLGCRNIAIVTEGRLKGTSRNTGSDKQTYYKLSLAGDEGDSVMNMVQVELMPSGRFRFEGVNGDTALCEASGSAQGFFKLVQLGVHFPTNEYGEFVGYKTDHDPFCRATSIGPYTSKAMTEVLEASVEKKGIRILDNLQAVKILTEEGRAIGLLCLDTGKAGTVGFTAISSPHVVLATGGPAAVYFNSVYPTSHTGNSSLALEAGEIQIHDWLRDGDNIEIGRHHLGNGPLRRVAAHQLGPPRKNLGYLGDVAVFRFGDAHVVADNRPVRLALHERRRMLATVQAAIVGGDQRKASVELHDLAARARFNNMLLRHHWSSSRLRRYIQKKNNPTNTRPSAGTNGAISKFV